MTGQKRKAEKTRKIHQIVVVAAASSVEQAGTFFCACTSAQTETVIVRSWKSMMRKTWTGGARKRLSSRRRKRSNRRDKV